MPETIDNQQKYENYKEQFTRLKKALDQGFNLEAMFIEYAIMEDRTESVLRHAGLWEMYQKHRKGHGSTIDSKVRYIKKHAENKKDLLNRYFTDDLLDRVLLWKEDRNRLIHALLKQQLAHNEVSTLAAQGNALVRELCARSKNANRAQDRAREKAAANKA